jgi:hypothetical protein
MLTSEDRAVQLAAALAATKESRVVDFKSVFDPAQTGDWCELLKDMFAFANSGGGIIIVGVDGKGQPLGSDVSAILKVDPADVGNKIRSYTQINFDEIEISGHHKDGAQIAVIEIGPAEFPLVPTKPGTYPTPDSKKQQATAFSVGVVFVRHGAKSEPATTDDLAKIIERRVREVRRTWMSGIKKVTTAPVGAEIIVSKVVKKAPAAPRAEYRLVLDKTASTVGAPDFDRTHPYRTIECLKLINGALNEVGSKVNVAGLKAAVAVNSNVNDLSFTWKSVHGPRQYSQACIDWIVERVKKDKYFIRKAILKLRRMSGS